MSPAPSTPERLLLISPAFHGYWRSIGDALARRGYDVHTARYDAYDTVGDKLRLKATSSCPTALHLPGDRRTAEHRLPHRPRDRADAEVQPHRAAVIKGRRAGSWFWDALGDTADPVALRRPPPPRLHRRVPAPGRPRGGLRPLRDGHAPRLWGHALCPTPSTRTAASPPAAAPTRSCSSAPATPTARKGHHPPRRRARPAQATPWGRDFSATRSTAPAPSPWSRPRSPPPARCRSSALASDPRRGREYRRDPRPAERARDAHLRDPAGRRAARGPRGRGPVLRGRHRGRRVARPRGASSISRGAPQDWAWGRGGSRQAPHPRRAHSRSSPRGEHPCAGLIHPSLPGALAGMAEHT